MKKRIIFVSNRLPVSVTEESGVVTLQRSNGGVATALTSVMDSGEYDAQWIGWSGSKKPISYRKLIKAGWDKRLLPVRLQGDVLHRYYERMSNGVLWPMLHGMAATIKHELADWKAYITANRKFADAVLKVVKPNDIIWVHDYHLLLVPQMLRAAGLMNRIGFFLHSPFARPEAFAGLKEYTDMVRSLAQVDVLGFQTDRDTDNFKASLKQMGIMMRPGSIARAFPIGVDFDAYHSAVHRPAVQRAMAEITRQLQGRRAILSVSRLDYTKGIPEQLLAYEQVLAATPDPTALLYKLVVAPSREDTAGYKELKQRIDREVARINRRFGTATFTPIDYTYRNCGFDELNAWYQLADVLLVTPIIDGMNLVVKEYIAARQDDQGMVVMSDTMGAAQQLHTALQVDPHDVPAITSALQHALAMPYAERTVRWALLKNNVQYQDVFWWLNDFLSILQSKAQTVLQSQEVHNPRMRFSGRLESLRLLRLARNR